MNCKIHQFQAITGLTDISGNTGQYQPYFTPTPFWFQKIELLMNNQVLIDTYYPDTQWITQQNHQMDEQQNLENGTDLMTIFHIVKH